MLKNKKTNDNIKDRKGVKNMLTRSKMGGGAIY